MNGPLALSCPSTNVAAPQVTIPRVEEGKDTVIIAITGKKKDITTAQYLMQKTLKGK